MTDKELQAIRERAEKATPGPWVTDAVESWYVYSPHGAGEIAECLVRATRTEDATFIAHAPWDIYKLLAEVAAMREIVRAVAVYRGGFLDGIGVYRCDFCHAREGEETQQPIAHTPDCPVTKARALLAWEGDKPS